LSVTAAAAAEWVRCVKSLVYGHISGYERSESRLLFRAVIMSSLRQAIKDHDLAQVKQLLESDPDSAKEVDEVCRVPLFCQLQN